MSYFNDCKTQEEAKDRYRSLAKKLHPDVGGDAEAFKAMQREYDKWKPNSGPSEEEKRYYQGFNKSSRFDQRDPHDTFGFRQQKQYSQQNQYGDIPFTHPVFVELNQYRQWVAYYKNESESRAKIILEKETRYHNLDTHCDFLKKEVTELKKELSKKKATATRLKNKFKKMQKNSLEK